MRVISTSQKNAVSIFHKKGSPHTKRILKMRKSRWGSLIDIPELLTA